MDSAALLQIISKVPTLKYRCLGPFSVEFLIFPMLNEYIPIVNTIDKVNVGHWIMLARLNDSYFVDSLIAPNFQHYPQLNQRMPPTTSFLPVNTTMVQKQDHFCGLYYLFCMEIFWCHHSNSSECFWFVQNFCLHPLKNFFQQKIFLQITVDFLRNCWFVIAIPRLANGISSLLMSGISVWILLKVFSFTLRYCWFMKARLSRGNITVESSPLTRSRNVNARKSWLLTFPTFEDWTISL